MSETLNETWQSSKTTDWIIGSGKRNDTTKEMETKVKETDIRAVTDEKGDNSKGK